MGKRKFACFDIDGTLHRGTRMGVSLGEEVTQECVRRELVPREALASVNELRRKYEFRQILFREYVEEVIRVIDQGFFAGLDAESVCKLAGEIAERERDRVYVFTRELLRTVQELGYVTIAISGSFYGVVEPFAKAWGFDIAYGTEYPLDEAGALIGTPGHVVVHAEDKAATLRQIIEREDLTIKGSIGIGDTIGDAPVFGVVEYPILFNPSSELIRVFREDELAINPWIVVERRAIYFSTTRPPYPRKNGSHPRLPLPPCVIRRLQDRLHAVGQYFLLF
jgi:HAD superfamily phosphoserine phosphatase-like hydrolase